MATDTVDCSKVTARLCKYFIPVAWFLEAAFGDTWGKGQASEQQELTGLQWQEYIFVLKKYIIRRFNVTLISPKRALSVFKGERNCKKKKLIPFMQNLLMKSFVLHQSKCSGD